jgi:glycogen(starch) synthase
MTQGSQTDSQGAPLGPDDLLADDLGAKGLRAALMCEVAWEVCNQIGGIYQVIRSKTPLMVDRWANRYCLIGPYEPAKATLEFEEGKPAGWIGRALGQLQSQGMTVKYGRWLVPGKPRVMLLQHWLHGHELDVAKFRLWEDHRLEFPGNDGLINAVVSFGAGVVRLLETLAEHAPGTRADRSKPGSFTKAPIIAQFHEWMAGLAIPQLRKKRAPVATIFTTHATQLGRYIAGGDDHFYDHLPGINDQAAAKQYNVVPQHSIERACAHGAHVFTTVSSITGEECTHLLGRSADEITPNGLNIDRYNVAHEQQRMHAEFKDRIHRFTMGHFFPSYSFDLDKTLYFFTSGRFEPRNKGFDVCLESMARLNAELKQAKLGVTVVFFIISSRGTKSLNPLALEKRGVLAELDDVCERIVEGVGEKLFRRAAAGGKLRIDDLVDEYWALRYRRTQHALRQNFLPMITTHMLEDDAKDPVLNHIRTLGLFNREDDPVKIVYHPDFINPANPLWGIEYDQFVRGCHLGIFPSAYEPWGYTPLECLAMGVPAVTSDLAGFGRFTHENFPDHDSWGLQVLPRRGRGFFDASGDLAWRLLQFCKLERRDRIALRNLVDRHSWDYDWSRLGQAYHKAHDIALDRMTAELGQVHARAELGLSGDISSVDAEPTDQPTG